MWVMWLVAWLVKWLERKEWLVAVWRWSLPLPDSVELGFNFGGPGDPRLLGSIEF